MIYVMKRSYLWLDGDIVVWANQHNVEFLENIDNVSVLGFMHSE